jgi:siroheme synthase (precorrin-2 oxidase/ferrochelatase)
MIGENSNNLFPVFLKLENLRVLIVGGGKVGLEKISAVLNNSPGTKLTVVATQFSDEVVDYLKNFTEVKIAQREH